jgi:hypothetical protein
MASKIGRSKRVLDKRALFEDMGYSPHPGQLEVHECTAPRRIVACGVRWGKTLAAAMEGVAAALQPAERSVGWIVAPTYDLADRVFREIQVVAYRHLRHRIVAMKEAERRLILRNMSGGTSEIRAKSADNPVSLLGEGLDWLVVDEASRLKPVIWQAHLSQRLIDKKGWALLISTPKGKGYFYDLFRRGQGNDPEFKSWNYPSWTNPLLDPEVIEQERSRLPQQVFKQEIGAEFTEGAGAVFRKVREAATGEFEASRNMWYSGGLDLAKLHDWTVMVVMSQRRQVVSFDRWTQIDWALQAKRIAKISSDYNRPQCYVDSTGAGEPIFEALRLAGLDVEAYPFTARSKEDLINNLSLMLEQGMIVLPKYELAPVLIDELEAYEYSVTESGHVRTSAPGSAHDDCVMGLALAAWRWRPHAPTCEIGRLSY